MSLPLSVIIMTRNEAANIRDCLVSCAAAAAEIIVVDSASSDDTAEIARTMGAKVVPFIWNGAYPKKKQWCLDNLGLSQPWTLFLDADERLTPEVMAEIVRCIGPDNADPKAGYYVTARVRFRDRLLRFGRRHCKLALFRTGAAQFPVVDDLGIPGGWEVEGHYQPLVDGPIGWLSAPMIHADAKPFTAWQTRHDAYARWAAAVELRGLLAASEAAEPRRRRVLKYWLKRLPFRPWLVALDTLVLKGGWLDGVAGFAYAADRWRYYRAIERHRAHLVRDAAVRPDAARARGLVQASEASG
jgi:glycosyltransferase involved in cell wall biosynthesis